ncbi:CFA99 protein, partial [Polypterus senegalus]
MKQKLAKVEQRRLEDKLRYEEAWLTRKKIIEENKRKATLQKEQTAELLQQCAEKCKDEEKEKKAFVKEVAEGEKNVQKSKEAVQKHKQRTGEETISDSAPSNPGVELLTSAKMIESSFKLLLARQRQFLSVYR